jgi:microcystin degradation protein MlrC
MGFTPVCLKFLTRHAGLAVQEESKFEQFFLPFLYSYSGLPYCCATETGAPALKIAIGGFQHETNTFAPSRADFEAFAQSDSWPALQRGAPLLRAFAGMNIPIAGFIDTARGAGHELLPLVWCSATPSAHVTEQAYEKIAGMLLEDFTAALAAGCEALYLDLHGAMVSEHLEDGEGELLRRLRAIAGEKGEKFPIIASLDLHANVTEAMLRYADALIAYRTYPHVDMAQTGARAARYLDSLLQGTPPQAKALRKLDFLIPLTAQCTLIEPARHLISETEKLEGALIGNSRVNSASIAYGFPLADIAEAGPAVIVYADTQAAADEAAKHLAQQIEIAETQFREKLWSPSDAVAYANQNSKAGVGPIVLADTQDNPGAGGNGDTVGLLREMIAQGAQHAALGNLFDSEAVEIATKAGEGARIRLALGAKTGGADEQPIDAEFEVVRLSDGEFLATGPFYGGSRISLGRCARLKIGGIEIVVASRKVQCADSEMFRHIGIEPGAMAILAVKSSVHFRADFGPKAKEVLVVESPGPNIADLTKLPFRRLRANVRRMPG